MIDSDELFQSLKPKLNQYLQIIPVFRKEYWPRNNAPQKVEISKALKDAVESNDSKIAIEMLLKWLYKVRCNLVHGEKSFTDSQQKQLLAESNSIMEIILRYLIRCYQEKYNLTPVSGSKSECERDLESLSFVGGIEINPGSSPGGGATFSLNYAV